MPTLTIEAVVERWPIAGEFVIARGAKREAAVVVAEVSERYGRDPDFRRTVDRFLSDFERLVRDIEQQSPRAVHGHLVSDAGRVYLFLAHASGRLR